MAGDEVQDKGGVAERIRDAILGDVTDRRGWRQEWDGFDEDVREEILSRWTHLIQEQLDRHEHY